MQAEFVPAPPKQHRNSPRLSQTASSVPTKSQVPSRSSLSSRSTTATSQLTLVEIQVPTVPRYIPNTKLPRELLEQKLAAVTLSHDRRNGAILSRFTKEDGKIGFTIRVSFANDTDNAANEEAFDVDLAKIYDYVTPAELERYEHHELELEAEREANRPKVGRPRKKFIMSTEIMGEEIKVKKPLGRPRKRPAASDQNIRTSKRPRLVFAGVHIPSPPKASQTLSTSPSEPTSSVSSQSVMRLFSRDNSSALEQETMSDTEDTRINIDQLTPSNARRVISVPQPSSGQRTHRPSYSMVNAALSESETEDDLPQSPSEDELSALIPKTQKRRFSAVAEVAESVSSDAEDPITISSSSASPGDGDRVSHSKSNDGDVDMLVDGNGVVDRDLSDHDQLLQQFHANSTRRLPSKSPTPPEHIPPPLSRALQQPGLPENSAKTLSHPQFEPERASIRLQTTPTRSKYIRKSMTPHFPSAARGVDQMIKPHIRGGVMDRGLGSPTKRSARRRAPTSSATNKNEITLGSLETSSSDGDRRIILDANRSARHVHNMDARLENDEADVNLGTPISSSSGETNNDVNMIDQTSSNGPRNDLDQTKNKTESPGPSTLASRWFGGMPWR
ncbi:MAG: hypothetical protein Q9192_001367 [Flavoplaca navasiana]